MDRTIALMDTLHTQVAPSRSIVPRKEGITLGLEVKELMEKAEKAEYVKKVAHRKALEGAGQTPKGRNPKELVTGPKAKDQYG